LPVCLAGFGYAGKHGRNDCGFIRRPGPQLWRISRRRFGGGFILPFGLKLAQLEIQGRSLDDDFLFGQSRHQLPIGETRLLHFRQFGGHEQDGLS